MRILGTVERDRVTQTIMQVKSAPFSPSARRIVGRTLPKNQELELMMIYRDSSEERRKKKKEEDEKNN